MVRLIQTIVKNGKKPVTNDQVFNLSRSQMIKHLRRHSSISSMALYDLALNNVVRINSSNGSLTIQIKETNENFKSETRQRHQSWFKRIILFFKPHTRDHA